MTTARLPTYRVLLRRVGFVLIVLTLPAALLNGESQGVSFGVTTGIVQALVGACCIWALPRLL